MRLSGFTARPLHAIQTVMFDLDDTVDTHYGTLAGLDLCDALGLQHVFGLSKTARLQEQAQTLTVPTELR